MIPKLIHYVWVGSELPQSQRDYIETWRATNPDYKIVCWNEENIDFSVAPLREAYRRNRWAKVADIARLLAVAEHGGFYLDTDFRLYRSLDSLLPHPCVFGFQSEAHPTDWVANGVMAAEPGHWFIRKARDHLMAMKSLPFGLDRPTKFGPKLITRLLREEGLASYAPEGVYVKDIFICPTRFFFPYAFGEEFRPSCVTPDTYGVHFWHKSWERDLPVPVRVAKWMRARAQRFSSQGA